MTIKKEKNKEKELNILKKKLKNKDIKIDKIKSEIKIEKEKLLTNIADLQNQLKRYEKEFRIKNNVIKKKYLIELVDILDLIKKAYNDKNSKKGIKLIINNIEKFLNDEKVKYIDCIGKTFDHKVHHAITSVNKSDCENNIIIDELKKGYYVNDDILRPSQVIVSKKSD